MTQTTEEVMETWGVIYDETLAHMSPMNKRKTLLRRVDRIARQNGYDDPSVNPVMYRQYLVMRTLVART